MFDIDKVKRLTIKDNNNSLERKMMKVSEEVGEFNQAALGFLKASNTSGSLAGMSDEELRSEFLEEGCDVLNSTMNILFSLFTDDEIKHMFDRKLNKWDSKL